MKHFTTFEDFPEDLAKALDRADCHYLRNRTYKTFRIISNNTDAPLTEDEKNKIRDYLNSEGFDHKVSFEWD